MVSIRYHQIYKPAETILKQTENLTLAQKEKVAKDIAKKNAKESAKADKALQKKLATHVTIKRIERSKRKYVTAIHGLQAFEIDNKKVSKELGKRVCGRVMSFIF